MIWDVEIVKDGLTVQAILDMIAALLKKIFGFVAKEEGWKDAE
jgi:hypothetical protein